MGLGWIRRPSSPSPGPASEVLREPRPVAWDGPECRFPTANWPLDTYEPWDVLAKLRGGQFIIVVHKSEMEIGILAACGAIQ